MGRIAEYIHGGPVDAAEVARVRDVIMFEEPGLRERLIRFWSLLVLASAIATFGLIGDSVATVIGAMIVAPLMLPIMGLAFSISVGDRRGILSSLLVAAGGILTAIAVGYLLSLPFSAAMDVEGNSQIMARTAPRLVDLAAALATGLAGAFAIGRKDISDTLPGVAIAISLVPPLANVGILLGHGRADLAMGSLLLFLTNYFAILLTGSFMYGLMGFPRAVMANQSHRARLTAITVVIVFALLIVIPLAATSYSVAVAHITQARVSAAADRWLSGFSYRVVAVTADDGVVRLTIVGSGERPRTELLENSLQGQLFGKNVIVETVPENREEFSTR